MDIGKVISRAWEILWRRKILWVLGLLAALGSGANPQVSLSFGRGDIPTWMQHTRWSDVGARWQDLVAWAPGIVALVFLLLGIALLLSLAVMVVSIIANGGLIAGVQQVEEEGSTSFRRAWRVGVQRFWTLLGIRLLFGLAVVVLVGLLVGFLLIVVVAGGATIRNDTVAEVLARVLLPLVCCGAPLCCGALFLIIALAVLVLYAERAAVLEKMGAGPAIVRGWQVLRQNLGNTLLIVLIVAGITVAVGWILGLLGAAVVLPFWVIIFQRVPTAGEVVGGALGMLLVWVVAVFVNSLVTTFTSAIWTLLYREAITPKPPAEPAPVAPAPEETPAQV